MSESRKQQDVLWRILRLFFKYRTKTFWLLTALGVSSTGLTIAAPFITQQLIDRLIAYFKDGGAVPLLAFSLLVAAILASTLLQRLADSTYLYQLFKTVTSFEDSLRDASIRKYLELHSLFHHGVASGQIMSRLERGAQSTYIVINELIGKALGPSLLLLIGITIAVALKDWLIALIIIMPMPVYVLSVRNITKKIYEIEKVSNEAYEQAAKEAYDVAGNIQTVKKFAQETIEADRIKQHMEGFRAIQYSAERLWAVLDNIQAFVGALGQISVIVVAGYGVFKGNYTVGEFVLFVTLQNAAYAPVGQLSQSLPRLRRNLTRVERLFDLLDEVVHVADAPDAKDLAPLADTIEFKRVSFSYHNDTRYSLKNISVSIPAHSTVALVGRSGSGKTTFVNMLLRSFDPQEGEILIDGVNIRTVTQKSLRNQIAVVPQDVDLFSRSIRENIAYGQPHADQRLVEQAAQTALAHDFIMKTEQGYDTVVGERGIKLSGGERQRVGIARAILRDPKILILDEATSHLDSESEKLITKATDALIKNRTTIIIAHRLSTILKADMILVFKHGTIEASGTHKELLKSSQTYKNLYELQFGD